jgi:hypothetical protein
MFAYTAEVIIAGAQLSIAHGNAAVSPIKTMQTITRLSNPTTFPAGRKPTVPEPNTLQPHPFLTGKHVASAARKRTTEFALFCTLAILVKMADALKAN